MKQILLVLSIACCMNAIGQKQIITATKTDTITKPKEVKDVISFRNEVFDFGKIPFGKPVEYQLGMKNISKDSVTIENVQVSCGCTTPKWTAGKKYAPGESFDITLGFNAGTKGLFQKTVTVFFNGGLSKVVTFKGETYEVKADSTQTIH